jgi:transcriptional regulator with XRE-family HTH domain
MAMTFKQAFGERLVVARFNCGRLSQEALAERAEIHRTQISLFETGQRMPKLETFVRLAGAVEQTPGELLGPIRWVPGTRSPGFLLLGEDER